MPMDQDHEIAEASETTMTEPSQTGNNAGRPGQSDAAITATTAQNLAEINQNMSKMASLLQQLFERNTPLPIGFSQQEEHYEGQSNASQMSDTDHRDDLSVTASDADVSALFANNCTPPEQAEQSQTHSSTDNDANNGSIVKDIELLKEIDQNLSQTEPVGPKIHENLANIANKRWGTVLPTDKLKTIMSKHLQPENCDGMSVPKVNKEVWDQMLHARKSADLRLSNIQSVLSKASFSLLKSCDHMVAQNVEENKPLITNTIDAIALMGHAVGELSNLRREQIRPALRTEFHSLCRKTDDSSHSPFLFGTDLAKRARDTKETYTLSRSLGSNKTRGGSSRVHRPSYRAERTPYERPARNTGNSSRYETGNRQFFQKGQKKTPFKSKQNRS